MFKMLGLTPFTCDKNQSHCDMITVGVFGHEEEVLDKPVAPSELKSILYRICGQHDVRQAVLQQELIIAIGKLMAFSPHLFEGILKIRIGWIVQAMIVELTQDARPVANSIHDLSPYQVQELLYNVLVRNTMEADQRTPFQKRQLDGALNRVPRDFYPRVWKILQKTPGGIKVSGYYLPQVNKNIGGIKVSGYYLPQQPTLSDMTMYEMNFCLLVEQMFSKFLEPAYRQLIVETVMVVSSILERNPELTFDQSVNLDLILSEACADFQKDRQLESLNHQEAMQRFFNTPPNVRKGTTSYVSKIVINNLLNGDLRSMAEDMCCIT